MSPDPINLSEETPHAVFVVVFDKSGRVAATTREDGKIGLPGGKVDPGETARDAVIREAREEGWAVSGVSESPIHKDNVDGKMVWWFRANSAKILSNWKEKPRGIGPLWVEVSKLSPGLGNEFVQGLKL